MLGMFVAVWLSAVLMATLIGNSKGRTGEGFALGFFLAWLGVIFAFFIQPSPELEAQRQLEVEQAKQRLLNQQSPTVDPTTSQPTS